MRKYIFPKIHHSSPLSLNGKSYSVSQCNLQWRTLHHPGWRDKFLKQTVYRGFASTKPHRSKSYNELFKYPSFSFFVFFFFFLILQLFSSLLSPFHEKCKKRDFLNTVSKFLFHLLLFGFISFFTCFDSRTALNGIHKFFFSITCSHASVDHLENQLNLQNIIGVKCIPIWNSTDTLNHAIKR